MSARIPMLPVLTVIGLAAWLTALTALAPSKPARAVDARMEPASRLLPAARIELATVLAGMVLLCTQPREDT